MINNVPLTCVCISGQLRSFFQQNVQSSFSLYFHTKGYEYFISGDQYFGKNDSRVYINPIRKITVVKSNRISKQCTNNTKGQFHLYIQALRISMCYENMIEQEKVSGINYRYTIRIRPDILWLKNFPQLSLNKNTIIMTHDLITISNRNLSKVILYYPKIAYSMCADFPTWNYACRKKINLHKFLKGSSVPCTPMKLITTIDKIKWKEMNTSGLFIIERENGKPTSQDTLFNNRNRICCNWNVNW